MKAQKCPKCKSLCDVSETNVELGTLIECQCGCKFEYIPKLEELVEDWSNKSKSSSGFSTKSDDLFTYVDISAPLLFGWKLHLFLAGACLLFSYFWRFSIITTLFLGCLILTSFCWKNKKAKKELNEKSVGYFFFDKCLEFSACLTIVVCFYTILAWVVDGTSNTTTLAWLESLEWFVSEIKKIISEYLKFKPWTAALIIFGLIIVDLLISYYLTRKKSDQESKTLSEDVKLPQSNLASHYKTYHTWTKRVYIVVVLLCSFTFFGNVELGYRVAHLRLKIDSIKAGYEKLKEETEESLMASVQQKLYKKIEDEFSSRDTTISPFRVNYPEIAYKYNLELDNLHKTYEMAKSKGVEVSQEATEIITESPQKSPDDATEIRYDEPKQSEDNIRKAKSNGSESEKSTIKNSSVEKIEATIAEVEKKTKRSRFIPLLKKDGTKYLLCQFPKSFIDVAKSKAFGKLMIDYPFLEPIIDVFVGTIDKTLEENVNKSAEKIADSLLEDLERAETLIEKEANEIAKSVEIKVPEESKEKSKKLVEKINHKRAKISKADHQLRSKIEGQEAKNRPPDPPKIEREKPCLKTQLENAIQERKSKGLSTSQLEKMLDSVIKAQRGRVDPINPLNPTNPFLKPG